MPRALNSQNPPVHADALLNVLCALSLILLPASWAAGRARPLARAVRQPADAGSAGKGGQEARVLEGGKPVERELAGGEIHAYRITARAGQFLSVIVEQRGVDVVVTLVGPDDKKLAEIDSPNGTQGPEPVSLVVDNSGAYRLEVRSLEKGAAPGRYEIKIAEQRAAKPQDRTRVEAERAYAGGVLLYNQGTAESLREALGKFEGARSLWRAADDRPGEVKALNFLATTHNTLRENQKALDYLNQALPLQRALNDRAGEAGTLAHLGGIHYSSGENQKALEAFTQALALLRATGDRAAESTVLFNIADVYNTSREYPKALEFYQQALALRRAAGDRRGEAQTLSKIGALHYSANDRRKAVEFHSQALAAWQAVGDRSEEAATLDSIALAHNWMGEKQQAVDYLGKSLLLRRAAGDRAREADTLNNIGVVYDSIGERQKALSHYEQALSLHRAAGDRQGEAVTLTHVGKVYAQLGEDQKARDFYGRALALWRAAGDRPGEANTLVNIGNLDRALNEYRKALDAYGLALALYRAAGDRYNETGMSRAIGAVYVEVGEYGKALDFYNRALPFFKNLNDLRGQAILLNDIGWAYYNLGEHVKALDYYNQSVQFERALGNKLEAQTLSNIARVYRDLGEHRKALDYLDQSLQLRRAVGDRRGESITLRNMGGVYTDLGEHPKALEQLTRSLALAREMKDRDGEGRTLSFLMSAWKAQNNSRLATFYGKQAVNVFQGIRTNIRGLERETQKNYLKSKADAYRQLADLLVSAGRLPEAQQVLGLLKEEEYLDFVRRDGGESSAMTGRAALTPEEAELEKRYTEIADQITLRGRERGELLAKAARTPEEEQQLAKIEADLNVAGQAFQKFLDRLSVEFESSKPGSERVYQLRESQALMEDLRELGAGAVALYTVVGEDKYRVILITPDAQKAAEYPIKAAELSRKVAAFREALQNPRSDPRPLAQELYKILIAPVAKDLRDARAETLMWSLDGVLRYTPMAALHDGEKYLVERYRNVVFTPASNSRLKDLPSAKWKGLGLGVSKAHAGFSPLPAVPEELRGIIREPEADAAAGGVLPGTMMMDEAFTEQAMKTALRQRYPVVHIASHFQFQPGNETDSFLLLGDGRRLSLAEIKASANLFGGVELLTLSACDTATGGTGGDGKEVEGFAVLAQRQGAKAVIASLWPVADESTRLLMQKFYRARDGRPGTPKVEALRLAQLSLLRAEESGSQPDEQRGLSPGVGSKAGKAGGGGGQHGGLSPTQGSTAKAAYAHPYYWAPFILIGNWR